MRRKANTLKSGDVIIERNERGKQIRLHVQGREIPIGCTGVHVKIKGSGICCYDSDDVVECVS